MKLAFFKHLFSEQANVEAFELLLKIDQFNDLQNEEEKLKNFLNIIETYFENDSIKNLKLGEKTKNLFFSKCGEQLLNKEKWILMEDVNIFEDIESSITKELKFGSFPRFVRSTFCEEIFLTNSKNRNIFYSKEEFDILTEEEDFDKPIVTEEDLDLLNFFSNENFHWNLVHTNKKFNMNTFKLKKNPFPHISFFQNAKVYKYESILPYSIEDCIESILSISLFNEFETNLFFHEEKSFLDSNQLKQKYPKDTKNIIRGNSTILMYWKFPILSELRRCLCSITSCYDKNGDWIRIIKPIKDKDINWNEKSKDNIHNKIYESFTAPLFIQYRFTKISEEKTKYTFIYCKFISKKEEKF